ncbi:chalcone--flavonone isomerase [Iris pallida]|uniref:Chalcone-flavonone isomerase family protein n=1 Tax=Iris pallida TaxID=29817 RepID=A0AAX6EEM7_IRIPA|nr:chalcone--flavonone isomerase [Iris pallida]
MSAQYMSALVLTKLVIAGFLFPATITSPGSSNTTLFLGGAGRRGLEMGGKFVTFTHRRLLGRGGSPFPPTSGRGRRRISSSLPTTSSGTSTKADSRS